MCTFPRKKKQFTFYAVVSRICCDRNMPRGTMHLIQTSCRSASNPTIEARHQSTITRRPPSTPVALQLIKRRFVQPAASSIQKTHNHPTEIKYVLVNDRQRQRENDCNLVVNNMNTDPAVQTIRIHERAMAAINRAASPFHPLGQ